jgi:hypothetical protein
METILAICAGIGLAAACGFRVFVPLLAMGIAVHSGKLDPPGNGFDWVGTWPALVVFGAATAAEIGAYFVPWLDHALDTIASPAAVGAGTLSAAVFLPELHPAIKWSLALIAGGGAAGVIQTGTVAARAISGATTGGLGNPAVSTVESTTSIVLSILAILVPILAAVLVVALIVLVVRKIAAWRRRRAPVPA